MLRDELAATENPIPRQMFNATVFSNLGDEYGEIVSACSVQSASLTFPELMDILTGHEVRLQMRSPVATPVVHATVTNSGNEFNFQTDRGRGSYRGRGRGRGHGPAPRRDPCPVCGGLGHNPYKCSKRYQGPTQTVI